MSKKILPWCDYCEKFYKGEECDSCEATKERKEFDEMEIPVLKSTSGKEVGKKLSRKKNDTKIRKAKALKLRAQGYSYSEIAEKVGYTSQQTAYTSIRNELEKIIKENATELIALSNLQLEQMMTQWAKPAQTDVKAAKLFLEIIKERNKLLGIATDKMEITHKVEKLELDWDNNQVIDAQVVDDSDDSDENEDNE